MRKIITYLKNPLWQNLTIIVTTGIWFVIFSLFWLFPAIKRAEDNAIKLQDNVATQTKDLLDQFIRFRFEDITHMGKHMLVDTEHQEDTPQQASAYFEAKSDFLNFTLLDGNGKIITGLNRTKNQTATPGASLADNLFFIEATSLGKDYISPVYFSKEGPFIRIARLIKEGNTVGVIMGELDLTVLWKIAKTPIVPDGKVYLVDETGKIIGDPDPLRSRSGEDLKYRNIVSELTKEKTPLSDRQYLNESEIPVMAYGLRMPDTKWSIVVEQNIDKALLQKNQTYIIAIFFTGASLFLMTILLFGTFRIIKTEKLKDEFLSLISHNFRTPITAIKGYLGLISGNNSLEPTIKTYLSNISSSIDVLGRLVEEVLSISTFGLIESKLNYQPTDMNALTEDALKDMNIVIKAKNITTDIKSDENLPLINIYKDRIHDVIVSLLDNAIKFSNQNGRIEIRIEQANHKISVSIKDYGVGIDKKVFPTLFQKFHRGTGYMVYDYPGMGLGLYYSKIIIERHGGKIWAESELGKGSTFYFTLPLKT